jgi:hypothetical protein
VTREEMSHLLDEIQAAERAVRHDGQLEYARDQGNAFANFDRVADDLGLTREQVCYIYFRKHVDGIVSHLNGHTSQREDVRGRIKDARMYLALLWGMLNAAETTPKKRRPLPAACQRVSVEEMVAAAEKYRGPDSSLEAIMQGADDGDVGL